MSKNQQAAGRLTSLYKLEISLLLMVLFIAVFAYYVVKIMDDVNEVNQAKTLSEFSQSINNIRAKWFKTRSEKVVLPVVNSQLKQQKTVAFTVNQHGWVIALDTPTPRPCLALLQQLQSVTWHDKVTAHLKVQSGIKIACEYQFAGKNWFEYRFIDGKITSKVLN